MIFNHLLKTLDNFKANIQRGLQKISKNILTFQKSREFIFSAEKGHIELNNIFNMSKCQKIYIFLLFKISYRS